MMNRIGTVLILTTSTLFVTGLFFWFQSLASIEISAPQTMDRMDRGEGQVEPAEMTSLEEGSILFGGDMMFDRYIRTEMRKHGDDFPLHHIKDALAGADLVVANLEGPISDNESISETSVIGARDNYFFTFDPSVAPLLKRFHIEAVNIGNNHILNFNESGVTQTKQFLEQSRVGYFGSPLTGDNRILVREISGMKVALVNYNQFVFQGKEKALADIAQAKQEADIIVLYAHWGSEYVPALPKVKELAHFFIEAGADVIIGSHPHVIQEKQVYQGKTIYYSLGNLVFDQYGDEATRQGLLVKMTLNSVTRALSFQDIPVSLLRTGETVLTPVK